ncbi:MAG: DUF4197 domain-containing protein [Lewinellaceae bacterium]|nr:DUF4197 domain-containing protein [Saprospiraceae bacterium]MCB9342724.1 DUF4197 domain-containing protein [Lewinellaceae bacterium]
MIKRTLLLLTALMLTQLSNAQLNGILKKAKDVVTKGGDISQEEAGNGLKEALNAGIGEAVDFLSAKDGYFKSPYKILVPDEAQKVVSKLKNVPGFGNIEADLTERMNRAAEDAATKAKPIFVAAIKGMTFQDAMNILMGNQDAATRYLQKSTFDKLYAEFKPVIQNSLDKVNAREYWKSAVTAYNRLPFVEKTNPELDDHVTRKALDGMFGLVEKKEKDIRSDVSLRNTDLLRKVFAKQDK